MLSSEVHSFVQTAAFQLSALVNHRIAFPLSSLQVTKAGTNKPVDSSEKYFVILAIPRKGWNADLQIL